MLNLIPGVLGAVTSLIGGNKAAKSQEKANAQNAALQREFAQNSIQWRVADARAAGIHPVFAMGASTSSASPSFQSVGDRGISAMGQDVSRALGSMTGRNERNAIQALSLERAGLENALLKVQIRNAERQGVPRVGQAVSGDEGLVPGQPDAPGNQGPVSVPLRRNFAQPGLKHVVRGVVPEVQFTKTRTGYAPVVSKNAKEGLEDMLLPELGWQIRNNIAPSFGANWTVPPYDPGKGREWRYHPVYQEYRSYSKKRPWDEYRR